ncbi:MAG: toprim domain-containing protein [Hyphomicrobium sp.]
MSWKPAISAMRERFGGADHNGPDGFLVPGPGHSSADRSLSVRFLPGGRFVVHSHAGDPFDLCRDYAASLLGIGPSGARSEVRLVASSAEGPQDDPRESNVQVAAELWAQSTAFSGSPADAYLASRLPPGAVRSIVRDGDALRWNGRVRAMVAAMTDAATGEFTGVHRTFLDREGRKTDRKMLGRKGVVRLWPDDAVCMGLAIGEGIETTLAGVAVTGFAPAWAALDAGQLERFPVLSGIEALTIFADNDASGTGQSCAEALALRWFDAGIETRILTPTLQGFDFADLTVSP